MHDYLNTLWGILDFDWLIIYTKHYFFSLVSLNCPVTVNDQNDGQDGGGGEWGRGIKRDLKRHVPSVMYRWVTLFRYNMLTEVPLFRWLVAITCPPLTIQSEGLDISPPFCTNTSAVILYASECRFSCKSGYQHYGPGLKTCDQFKTWYPVTNPWCRGYYYNNLILIDCCIKKKIITLFGLVFTNFPIRKGPSGWSAK